MCMEDICLGRKSKYRESVVVIAAGVPTLLPGRAGRTRLIISQQSAGSVYASQSSTTSSASTGLLTTNTSPYRLMRVEDYGGWMMGDLWLFSVGGSNITIVEVWLDEECKQ